MVIFLCDISEESIAIARCLEDERAMHEEEDMAIEAALGPWPLMDGWIEETEVELVPIEIAEMYR